MQQLDAHRDLDRGSMQAFHDELTATRKEVRILRERMGAYELRTFAAEARAIAAERRVGTITPKSDAITTSRIHL